MLDAVDAGRDWGTTMEHELDHVLFFTSPGAPVVDRLVRAGFREGSRNTHPGQGTANRRLFFANAYLEFPFPVEHAELRSALVEPTGILARFEGGCPLGVALRSTVPGPHAPFPTWDFTPPYLPTYRPA
jgi:hypothetical protein